MSPSSHQSLYQQNPSRTSSWHSSEGNQDGAKIHILQYSCVSSMLTMLLDSGSAGNFIHQVTVHHLNILTHPLEQPRKILAIDGGPNGEGLITHCMQPFPLQVRVPHHVHVTLLVTISAKHPMILGLPWLEKHNPIISWSGKQVTDWSQYCHNQCLISPEFVLVSTSVEPRWPPSYLNFPRIPRPEVSIQSQNQRGSSLLPGTMPPHSRIYQWQNSDGWVYPGGPPARVHPAIHFTSISRFLLCWKERGWSLTMHRLPGT